MNILASYFHCELIFTNNFRGKAGFKNNLDMVRAKNRTTYFGLYTLKPCIYLLQSTFLFFLSLPAFSQNQDDKEKLQSTMNQYILRYDTIVSIKLNINTEYDYFEVNGDDFFYDIRPNISLSNKLSFAYRFISFGIGFTPKFIPGNNDNDLQGKTKTFSFGVNISTSHWLQELQYVTIKGFYLHNTDDYQTGWNKGVDPYIQFPDLRVKMLRGSTGYKFNPNFSLKAISSQSEKQLKSCGSLISLLNYDLFNIDNKSKDSTQSSSQRSNNFALTASLGYIYTFVLSSKFYTSLGIIPGGGFQHTNLLTRTPDGDIETKYTDPVFRISEKAGIGYGNDKFFTGAEISLSQAMHKQSNTSVQTKASRTFFQVFLGYRFNAPGFLRKETDAVKGIAPEIIKKNLE